MKLVSVHEDCANMAASGARRYESNTALAGSGARRYESNPAPAASCARRNNSLWSIVVAVMAVFVLTACDQHDVRYRVRWSPDGSKALVVASDGLRLANQDGNLSPVLLKDAYPLGWMPDSTRFAACRREEVRDWKTAQQYLSKAVQDNVIENAKKLRPILLAHKGDWEHWSEAEEAQIKTVNLTYSDAILVYLRDHDQGGALKKEMGDKVPEYLKGHVKIDVLEIHRLSDQTSQVEKVVYKTAAAIKELRPSPNAAAIVLVEESKDTSGDSVTELKVVFTDGGSPLLVGTAVARFPDWSPDGRSVVYIQREDVTPEVSAAKLCKRQVLDDQDKPLKEPGTVQVLAVTAFDQYGRARCLKDGSTIFSSSELVLPSAPDSPSHRPMLFSFDPKYSNLVRVIPDRLRYSMGAQCDLFEVSADGKHLAVISESGVVHVLDVASGKNVDAQSQELDPDTYRKAAFMPEWRTNDELTFAGPAAKAEGSKRIADVILYSVTGDKGASISDKWPAEARAFLDQPAKESGPAQEKQPVPKPQ